MQLRKGGKIRIISKMLSHDEMMDFLSKTDVLYYGCVCPRIWGHDTSEDVPIWEKNVSVPDSFWVNNPRNCPPSEAYASMDRNI